MALDYVIWNIDPEIFQIFGISIRYYGLFFGIGILLSVVLLRKLFYQSSDDEADFNKLVTYGVFGILLGARLGHCLFYEPSYYLSNPLEILLPIRFEPDGSFSLIGYQGLASHGGALGLIVALVLFTRKTGRKMLETVDNIAVVAPVSAFFIRMANLMNSEIIGAPSDVPWAFVFVSVDAQPRHPAQLYEALAYLFIFGLMYKASQLKKGPSKPGRLFGLCIALIFTFRILIEFVKENQVGFEAEMLFNMGQLLSIPYVFIGLFFFLRTERSMTS